MPKSSKRVAHRLVLVTDDALKKPVTLTLLPTQLGEQLRLTLVEQVILGVLWENRGATVDNQELLRRVWGPGQASLGTLRAHLSRLREKVSGAAISIEATGRGSYRLTFDGT